MTFSQITTNDLHDAADVIYDETFLERVGLTPDVIEDFFDSSTWWESPEKLREFEPDRLSMALGIAVGAAAMHAKLVVDG